MYASSHVYCTTQITGSKDLNLVFGSLFPDFLQMGSLPRGFEQRVDELRDFLQKKYSDLEPIAIGMCLHEYPIGVDRFIHQSYKGSEGYAFQFVKELKADAEKIFPEPKLIPLMTHFLVENAIEHKIATEHPDSTRLLRSCFEGINRQQIVQALASFYNVSEDALNKEYAAYQHSALDFDCTSYEAQGKLWAEQAKNIFNWEIDSQTIAQLIEKTQKLIDPTVDELLQYCIAKCREDFTSKFPNLVGNM